MCRALARGDHLRAIAEHGLIVDGPRGTFSARIDASDDAAKLGADVILPMGITQCPVHIKPDWLMQELGVPVVEGIGAPIRLAAMLVSLKLNYSRVYWPKSGLVKGK